MSYQIKRLPAGLTFVATPIGSARDITLRGLDVLASADVLVAEDTRTLRKLMDIHGVPVNGRPLIAYHDHNGAEVRPRLLALLAEGRSLAYTSEAGTPLVADPGYALARDALAAGHAVTAAPGPSAAVAALSIAGLPTDRFLFVGFLPAGKGARRSLFAELSGLAATLVFYESPKRIHRTLTELCENYGTEREAAVCREITKRFEEVSRGTLGSLAADFKDRSVKGEIVLLVGRDRSEVDASDMEGALNEALTGMSVKDAAAAVALQLGLPRRQVYQAALAMPKPGKDESD